MSERRETNPGPLHRWRIRCLQKRIVRLKRRLNTLYAKEPL
jgi:hypothetical protein